jgi:hypothetical protein
MILTEVYLLVQKLVGLSLWGSKVSSQDAVLEAVAGLKHLKALWINGNPIIVEG